MNPTESPSTALRAPSPQVGEKDGMRGVRFMERAEQEGCAFKAALCLG